MRLVGSPFATAPGHKMFKNVTPGDKKSAIKSHGQETVIERGPRTEDSLVPLSVGLKRNSQLDKPNSSPFPNRATRSRAVIATDPKKHVLFSCSDP